MCGRVEMLYLFITGNRSAYLNMILTILYFPETMTYDLKYKDANINSIVDSSAGILHSSALIKKKVMILFNDELGNYIPLRFGTLQNMDKLEDQIYYTVRLEQYCHVDCPQDFCRELNNITNNKIRRLLEPGRDEDNKPAEGILVICGSEISESLINKSSDSWIKTVRELGKQIRFAKYYSIFTKLEIVNNKVEIKDNEICLKSGKEYTLRFTYYIPDFNKNPMQYIGIDFHESNKILGLLSTQDAAMAEQNKIEILCRPNMETHQTEKAQFRFALSDKEINEKEIQYARTPVKFTITDRMPKWAYCVLFTLCVVGVATCTYISTLNYNDILEKPEDTLKVVVQLCGLLAKMKGIQNLVCSALTGIFTCGMVKLIGKPKL